MVVVEEEEGDVTECRCNILQGREWVCSCSPALGSIQGCCSYSSEGREYFYNGQDRECFYNDEDRECFYNDMVVEWSYNDEERECSYNDVGME